MKQLMHPTRSIGRLRQQFSERRNARIVEGSRAPDPAERELIEGRMDDWKEDVFAASGNGVAVPGLPATTPKGLYEEFERDAAKPGEPT
jgi:hypothetical protein